MQRPLDIDAIRARFPGLRRTHHGVPALFADGPAGSQVPAEVADAVRDLMLFRCANHGGAFATSQETDAMLDAARRALADLLGAPSPDGIVFGPNMTTLTFQLSRALARTWQPGDEVLTTDSEHDANWTPWALAARDAGAVLRSVRVLRPDGRLDLDDFAGKLNARTRLVAVGAASNLTGTRHPVAEICAQARAAGALTFVDAVHSTPHFRSDVRDLDCDFLCCSVYKFFGPHVGVLCARPELLEQFEAYKVRPAGAHGPDKWQTGTANFEGIAGTLAAVGYLASLCADLHLPRREALVAAMARIERHELQLSRRFLHAVRELPGFTVHGIADPEHAAGRTPTFALTHARRTPAEMAQLLAAQGIFSWSGNSYAVPLSQSLGLEPHGVLRLGLLHYNTEHEIDRLVTALPALIS